MEEKEKLTEGTVFLGSGNVFADLDLPNHEELLVKAKIAAAIHDVIRARGLTQKQAAGLIEIDQPKVSKVIRGNLTEFSTEWLLSRLVHLGVDVDIVAHTKAEPQNREGSITFACV